MTDYAWDNEAPRMRARIASWPWYPARWDEVDWGDDAVREVYAGGRLQTFDDRLERLVILEGFETPGNRPLNSNTKWPLQVDDAFGECCLSACLEGETWFTILGDLVVPEDPTHLLKRHEIGRWYP